MKKEKQKPVVVSNLQIDEHSLFEQVVTIIENRRRQAGSFANREITLMYWEIGKYVSSVLLGGERAEYGKRIVATLSQQLTGKYGQSFEYTKITRMIKFAELFPDAEILATLSQQLSWSHFIEILPLKNPEARLYYAKDAAVRHLGVRDLRKQISRKAYERCEIANSVLTAESTIPFNMFKDPYILDVLGLKDNFLEADLEKSVLSELEAFILEFGHGFTFVERQKRMTMDSDDFTLDLLFFHRKLRRLVAVELKIGRFKPNYMGQMRFYLKWLDKYERQEGENSPIGIILCPTASRDQIELMELHKEGIAVAEYWTELPPKVEFERKIKEILSEAQERFERRKAFPRSTMPKQIEYFYEQKNDDIDDT